MWLRIFYRLRQAWVRIALWKRAVAIGIGLCLLIQLAFGVSLWREATARQQLAGKARLYFGKSPLSPNVQQRLLRFVTPERLQLLAPVEAASITLPTDDDFRSISRLNVKRLTIRFGNLSAMDLRRIGWVSQLETLELDCDNIDPKALAPLTECGKLRRLRVVGRLAPEALSPLRYCVALDELRLAAIEFYGGKSVGVFEPITGSHLAELSQIRNLTSPRMSSTALDRLAGAQRLERLYLDKVDLQNGSLNGLSQLPQLKVLALSLDTPRDVNPLEGFPALSILGVRGGRISHRFLGSLRRLPHLDTLSFSDCRVNDSLPALAKYSKLKRLNLEASDATVEGIRRIGRLYTLEVLRTTGFQYPEDYRDLFPRLQSTPAFSWNFGLDKETWRYGVPMGGGGFF
jgi:Leucine-rich repeat (LRR) protein